VVGWRDIGQDWVVAWRGQLLRVINVDDSDPQRRQKLFTAETGNGIEELTLVDNAVLDGATLALSDIPD